MSERGRARLFVALDPPPSVRAELAGWARGAARAGSAVRSGGSLRVLEEDLLHVTICFLGERPAWQIGEIAASLRAVEGSVGELSLGAPVWLPPRRPRALAVEISAPGPGLGALHERLFEVLAVEPDGRRFRPHVTVARMPPHALPERRDLPPTPALSFAPRELILYRSQLSPEGASYEPLATRELASGP